MRTVSKALRILDLFSEDMPTLTLAEIATLTGLDRATCHRMLKVLDEHGYVTRPPGSNPAHVLVVSDDGVTTMFDKDERGRSGWDVAATALRRAAGGGTLVLNLPAHWETYGAPWSTDLVRARNEGWGVHRVATWDDLLAFAREFSRRAYTDETAAP